MLLSLGGLYVVWHSNCIEIAKDSLATNETISSAAHTGGRGYDPRQQINLRPGVKYILQDIEMNFDWSETHQLTDCWLLRAHRAVSGHESELMLAIIECFVSVPRIL